MGQMLPIFGLELLYNVLTLGYRNLNTWQFDEISKDTISKIKYTALLQKWMKPSLKSSSAIYDYVKVQ